MSTKKLFLILVFIGIFVLMLGLSMGFDTWWHMKTGELIWESKSIINTDPFSFTRAGETWYGPATNWLSDLTLYGMFNWLEFQGLMIWVAILMTFTFLFIFLAMEGNSYWNGFVLILGVIVMSAYRLPRPVLVSNLMVAIYIWQFELFRKRKKKSLFILPFLMIIWANAHGGILLAVLIWGVYFLNEILIFWKQRVTKQNIGKKYLLEMLKGSIGHLLLIFVLLLLGLSINPQGPRMILYTFEQMDINLAIEKINEWQSPNFHMMYMKFNLIIFILGIFAMVYSKRKVIITDILLFTGFFTAMLIYVRFLPYFVLASMLVFSRYGNYFINDIKTLLNKKDLSEINKSLPKKLSNGINIAILAVVIIISTLIIFDKYFINLDVDSYLADRLPVDGVSFLKENGVQGNLFNKYGDGGYIIWEMPDVKVYIDGRADLYRDEFLGEYDLIYNAEEGWQEILEKWNVETVFIAPDSTLAKVLIYEDWNLVFKDDRAVIYYKK